MRTFLPSGVRPRRSRRTDMFGRSAASGCSRMQRAAGREAPIRQPERPSWLLRGLQPSPPLARQIADAPAFTAHPPTRRLCAPYRNAILEASATMSAVTPPVGPPTRALAARVERCCPDSPPPLRQSSVLTTDRCSPPAAGSDSFPNAAPADPLLVRHSETALRRRSLLAMGLAVAPPWLVLLSSSSPSPDRSQPPTLAR